MAYNLQGIIRKTTTNMAVEFDRMAYITQNFANVNTNGYKSVRFEDIIDADGSVHGVERTDCRVGEFLMTDNPLDIALQGAGYIPVTTPQGEIRYTRDGAFMKNADGYLITKTGDLVGSGIKIDGNCEKVEIKSNGDVYTYKRVFDKPEYVGTIPVVQFDNPEALKDVGANEFVATENSGKIRLVENHDYIKQYGIERSNVDVISDIYMVSRINASILASSSLMKAINSMYDKAIELTQ